MENTPVDHVDVVAYAGRWFVLYSMPLFMDAHWRRTVSTYVIHPDGYYAVFTTYQVAGETRRKYMRSKLQVVRGSNNARMKSQHFWPIRNDYWVIELAPDYSYAVVGHPKHKLLFIMSRKPSMDEVLLQAIIGRCKAKGYDVSKLSSQHHTRPGRNV